MHGEGNQHAFDFLLLGNTMVARLRRELRKIGPEGAQIRALAGVMSHLDAFARSLEGLGSELQPRRKRSRHRGREMDAVAAGFHAALQNLNGGMAPEVSLTQPEEVEDEAEELGYRGGPFKVADVLVHLSLMCRSGTLTILGSEETVTIEMVEGDVVNAFSDRTPEGMRLGEILVAQGAVRQEALDGFIKRHEGQSERMGRALKSDKLVTGEQLAGALRFQFQQLFTRCLGQRDAVVTFRTGTSLGASHEVRLDVVGLLMEGMPNTRAGEVVVDDDEAVPEGVDPDLVPVRAQPGDDQDRN